jgi:hypothetical protein
MIGKQLFRLTGLISTQKPIDRFVVRVGSDVYCCVDCRMCGCVLDELVDERRVEVEGHCFRKASTMTNLRSFRDELVPVNTTIGTVAPEPTIMAETRR